VVATRHDTHAQLVVRALQAGKHVFVEKPLALTEAELMDIDSAYRTAAFEGRGRLLMVGFNRRFASQVREMKRLLDTVASPKAFVMTVNAGEIPPEHWTQDRAAGGGRIVGEACHFVDLLRFLADAPICGVQVTAVGRAPGVAVRDDKVSFTLSFADGSFGTVHYLANGHKAFPKERLEVFCAGRILQLDNFRRLRAWGWPGFRGSRHWRQDKGQQTCVSEFLDAVRNGGRTPIPYEELQEVSRWTLRIADEALQ
jgi:predicted dehydrogenase